TQSELRAVQLISGARGARVHRRRWSGQALVHKQLDLDATILSTSILRIVFRNRIQLTVAIRSNDATKWNVVTLNKVTNYSISTTLAECTIKSNAASR